MIAIYGIYNTIENLWYIGSSINIARRQSEHFSKLRSGIHENKRLTLACNTPGIDSFKFQIIEEHAPSSTDYLSLARLEEFYIKKFDSYVNGYNQTDNVIGSCMQSLNVRMQHWGEKHGGSTYSNEVIEKAFQLLHSTNSTYAEISEITGVTESTLGYIKLGGHEWVHLKHPEASKLLETRKSVVKEPGVLYSNNSIIGAFKLLLDNPLDSFTQISTKCGIPVETISAISTGRQYSRIILSSDISKEAEYYYSIGRLEYRKLKKKMPVNIVLFIDKAITYIINNNEWYSRDRLHIDCGIPENIARKLTEFNVDLLSLFIEAEPKNYAIVQKLILTRKTGKKSKAVPGVLQEKFDKLQKMDRNVR